MGCEYYGGDGDAEKIAPRSGFHRSREILRPSRARRGEGIGFPNPRVARTSSSTLIADAISVHTNDMSLRRIAYYATVLILLAAAGITLLPIVMRFSVDRYIYASLEAVPMTDAVMVLGASVINGKPSPVLERRAKTAIDLYLAGRSANILVTGDNGALNHDEVTPVRKYLLDAGIPAGDIFLDHAGFDTYSSMYRARAVFEADSITIVTQDFHLPRALFLARSLGLEAYGVPAEGGVGSGRDYLREIPASVKAVLNLMMRREPKYLGETIPLDGDGSTTWY